LLLSEIISLFSIKLLIIIIARIGVINFMSLNGLSLFSNVGIAELYFKKLGVEIVVANEILDKRAKFYQENYPNTEMIIGDIKKKKFFNKIVSLSRNKKIDFIITTPPCQGMSNAGKKDKNDPRNELVTYAINIILKLKPKYVFLENVPQQLKTFVNYKDRKILIPKYLKQSLKKFYNFNENEIVNAANYGVPQNRVRSIMLLTRKDLKYIWNTPKKNSNIKTLKDSIGNLPPLDPLIYDLDYKSHLKIFPEYEKKLVQARTVSKWHIPPKHVYRQVLSMMYTPTGKSAFQNEKNFRPKKNNGTYVQGFKNTYKRQTWNKPGYTITTYNRTIGSQENVHPGRLLKSNGSKIYSDPRVLTVYEIMKVMSIPTNWKVPNWCSENFLRQVIGEGIPPLLVKHFFKELIKIDIKNVRKN